MLIQAVVANPHQYQTLIGHLNPTHSLDLSTPKLAFSICFTLRQVVSNYLRLHLRIDY